MILNLELDRILIDVVNCDTDFNALCDVCDDAAIDFSFFVTFIDDQ